MSCSDGGNDESWQALNQSQELKSADQSWFVNRADRSRNKESKEQYPGQDRYLEETKIPTTSNIINQLFVDEKSPEPRE